MFTSYVFLDNTARNVSEGADVVGFQVETLITYYRGVPLSMIHNIEMEVDGAVVPRDELIISANGEDWFTLEETPTVTTYRWEYGDPLRVRWLKAGGLDKGEHTVTLRQLLWTAYIAVPFGAERTRTITIQ